MRVLLTRQRCNSETSITGKNIITGRAQKVELNGETPPTLVPDPKAGKYDIREEGDPPERSG